VAQRLRRRIRYTETTFGRGRVVELAGFFIHGDFAANTVSLAEAGAGVADEAEVVPMCGCPVEPGSY
jgi:hypothetical protein